LRLQFVSKENTVINKFLRVSFPKRCKVLHFIQTQGNEAGEAKQGIGFYLNALSKISHRITTEVSLRGFQFNTNHLKRIFSIFKHIERFELRGCKLNLMTSPDLSRALENCTLLEITCDFSETNENESEDKKLQS